MLMKKKYIKPNIRIHRVEEILLAGSGSRSVTSLYKTRGAFAKGGGGFSDDDDYDE